MTTTVDRTPVDLLSADDVSAACRQASDARLPRADLTAQLAAAAPELARTVAGELDAHSLGSTFTVPASWDEDGTWCYSYRLTRLKWGPLWRRQSGLVLMVDRLFSYALLWDPRAPDRTWDTTSEQRVNFSGLRNERFQTVRMANAAELAQFCLDAPALLDRVVAREHAVTDHLASGLAAADSALCAAR